MKLLLTLAACSALAIGAVSSGAAALPDGKENAQVLCLGTAAFESNAEAARAASSEDAGVAAAARAFLRGRGVEGLKALRETYADDIKQRGRDHFPGTEPGAEAEARWSRIAAAFCEVAQQQDAWAQGAPLFWHNDLAAAQAEARKSGKPVLTLRLLGKLTDEFSCANSRFFRAALYPNEEVARYMSENYVLCWSTERPVPRVTIDMGDGRIMTCTITGNSAHYVLDAQGRVLDCIPGLYGPLEFKAAMERGISLSKELAGKETDERARLLSLYHRTRLAFVNQALASDLRAAGVDINASGLETIKDGDAEFLRKSGAVPAEEASKRAVSKSRIENAFFVMLGKYDRAEMEGKLSAEVWARLAALHPVKLDEGSIRLMKEQNPESAQAASRRATSKMFIEAPIFRLVRKFESNLALDTVRNEYLFHAAIHGWFANGEVTTFEKLNERVYAELFATPASDPWLGLKGDDYTGLKNDGISR